MRSIWRNVVAIGALCVWAGTAAVGGDEPGVTTLRGVLVAPGTNAPAGVVAVLHDRREERKPCALTAATAAVADTLRKLTAAGKVVLVTGRPGEEYFTVVDIRADGRARTPDADSDGHTNALIHLPIHWVGVPAGDR